MVLIPKPAYTQIGNHECLINLKSGRTIPVFKKIWFLSETMIRKLKHNDETTHLETKVAPQFKTRFRVKKNRNRIFGIDTLCFCNT